MTDFSVISYDALMEHRQRQEELGFTFPLFATSIGYPEIIRVRVRRLSLMSKAAVERLDTSTQEKIWNGIRVLRDARKERQRQGNDDGDVESFEELLKNNDKTMPAARAYALASFIDPPLVEHQHQVKDNPGSWWIGAIHEDDILAFWIACNDSSSEQAKRFRMFQPAGAIEATGTVSVVDDSVIDATTRPVVPSRPAESVATAAFTPAGNAPGGLHG